MLEVTESTLRQRYLHDPEVAGSGGGVAGSLDEDAFTWIVDGGMGQRAGGLRSAAAESRGLMSV